MMRQQFAYAFAIGSSLTFWKRRKRIMSVPQFDAEFSVLFEKLGTCFYRRRCVTGLKKQLSLHSGIALDLESLFKLALKGSPQCLYIPTASLEIGRTMQKLEEEIRKLKLDNAWQNVLKLNVARLCEEHDLSCENESLITSEVWIDRLLAFLVLKSEEGFGETLIDQNFLSILMDLYKQMAKWDRRVSINVLEMLSNIAMQNQKCATAIAKSEWLQVLSSLVTDGSLEESLLAQKVCVNALSTFRVGSPRLKTNVYQLYCSNDEPILDIVFIHGLKGSVFRTWREKDNFSKLHRTRCWPKDWLPDDISVPVRILAVDYASSLVQFSRKRETFAERSQRLLHQLREACVSSRPVVFICHSMGGLLAKNFVLNDEKLCNQTVGILFFATPHLGSPMAKYGYIALRPAHDVTMLRYNNEANKKLHDEFMLICHKVPIITSVLETEKAPLFMGRKGVLVPWESAFFELGSVYHIKDFHYNVCKPRSRVDNIYKIVLQFIGDSVHYVKNN